MKKTFNIFSIIAFASCLVVASCDALDLVPEDKITPDTYFNTEESLRLYTNNLYSQVMPESQIWYDTGDINIYYTLDQAVSCQRVIPETDGGFYRWGWTPLRNINYLIEKSANCKDEAVRNRYVALSRFFRATFYFQKVMTYGDVPWYDSVVASDDEDALCRPRDPRETVMQNILADIDFALKYLPVAKDVYQVNYYTALALKSRVCLFEGTFRKYHGIDGAEKYLNECVKASEELIDSKQYSIYSDGTTPYRQLFINTEAIDKEIILARDYSESLRIGHGAHSFTVNPGGSTRGFTRWFINSYLMKDGSRFTDKAGYQTMSFVEECKDRDPRLAQTIRTSGFVDTDGKPAAPQLSVCPLGYHPIKYYMGKEVGTNSAYQDLPIYRIAEIYLNFAEAKAELGTLTQADIDKSVKLLRDRVKMPNLNMSAANSNPDPFLSDPVTGYKNVSGPNAGVILEIRRERAIELVMEGFRYWDIMRWKEGHLFEKPFTGLYFPSYGKYDLTGDGVTDVTIGETNNLTEGDHGYLIVHQNIERHWNEDRDYFYPIPTKERILTNGALTQNPGWNDGLPY